MAATPIPSGRRPANTSPAPSSRLARCLDAAECALDTLIMDSLLIGFWALIAYATAAAWLA